MIKPETTPKTTPEIQFETKPETKLSFKKKNKSKKSPVEKQKFKSKNKVKKSSIKKKLILGMTSLTVSICLLTGLLSGYILYRNSYNGMKSSVELGSKSYAQVVQNKIEQYKTAIETMASDESLFSANKSEEELAVNRELLAKKYGFLKISIVNSQGKSDDFDTSVSNSEYFKKAMKGETYISSPVKDKSTSKLVMYLAAKLKNSTQTDGIIIATLSNDVFCSILDDATVGKTGYSFIQDKNKTIIAHKNRTIVSDFTNYADLSKNNKKFASIADVSEHMAKKETGSHEYKLNNEASYIAYCPVVGTDGWSIGVTAKVSDMMSDFYSAFGLSVMVMLIFIAISVFVATRIALPIVNPIAKLVARIEGLADGDLHTEVPVIKKRDEIGMLSQTFSDTVNTLNAYIREIDFIIAHISEGDLTVAAVQNYKGDFVSIKASLDKLVGSLNQIFSNINVSADQVASGAEQVSAGSQAMSQGTTEQASSIEELSAAINEIADKVNRNAASSKKASELSQQSYDEVEKGNKHMQDMIAAMSEISETSDQISKIIKTIDDIAFQTNILALNAAVEAARAGAAGKGFAVVADEVRNLAGKSVQAAKNTATLIENSINAVSKGEKIAAETGEALVNIRESAIQTKELIEQISVASNDQATSISQITQGVEQISAVVQTNSATAEESAATSEELSGQAQVFKQMLANIKLKQN